MTGPPAASKRSKPAANATNESQPSGPFRDPVPMKPRKGLFAALMVVLAVECAGCIYWALVKVAVEFNH